jgi:hypothetical protein
VTSLWTRAQDLYRLKIRYRYLLVLPVAGFVAGVWPIGDWAYEAQLTRGLTPGAPLGSEPGSIGFLFLALSLMLGSGLLGMALCALALCFALPLFSSLTLRYSVRAIFLSHYPSHWFRE